MWDPYFAIAETRYKPRVLTTSAETLKVNTYFLANSKFAAAHPDAVTTTIGALKVAATSAAANRDKVAQALHDVTNVPLEAQTLAANRAEFGIGPVTPEIAKSQQETLIGSSGLGLIPKQINVADAVWKAQERIRRAELTSFTLIGALTRARRCLFQHDRPVTSQALGTREAV